MSKKDNNFSKAMYDMFGVGSEGSAAEAVTPEEPVETPVAETPIVETPAAPICTKTAYSIAPTTYLAPDTVMEGTLRTKSDVEIAGTFTGDIFSEGDVTLHTSVTGNVSARNMTLLSCTLNGECTVTESANINMGSAVSGNISAKNVQCNGSVTGDMNVSGTVKIASTAHIKGNITAASLSVEPGAVIDGKLTIAK